MRALIVGLKGKKRFGLPSNILWWVELISTFKLLVNLRKFIEEECMARLCYVEQGGCIDTQTFSSGCEGQF
jgi:hypothetical protein